MANGRRDDAVITIKAEETEWLLHPSAGNECCCIFRVPQCLGGINSKTYQPHIVSIGPYHYGKQHLQMMQQHKQRYLRNLLHRTESTGPNLGDYLQAVASREEDIRRSYSESINFCSHDLFEMMVLDGIFTIELFCIVGRLSPSDPDDPIFNLRWLFPNLIRDLLRLENQIPFFVLQILFDKSKASREDTDSSLAKLALEFISFAVERPEEVLNQQVEAKHLLDLLRLSFIPQPPHHPPQEKKLYNLPPPLVYLIQSAKKPLTRINPNMRKAVKFFLAGLKFKTKNRNANTPVQFIQSAKKLYLAGIKFKTFEALSFLDITFHNGVLEIPNLSLDDLRTTLFLNFVAFEQCYYHCSRYMTTYAAFMLCLIRTPEDATFLIDNHIIENYLGTDEEVADFFRILGKDVSFDIGQSYLCNLFKDVNQYQRNAWHVRWAGFKFTYFDTPWSFLSAVAAVILLLLTVLQAFYAVYAYYHPR